MKKTKRIIVALLVAATVMSMVFMFCSCGTSSRFVGNWVCDEVHSGYPDQLTLNSDGTGTGDGFSCSWTAQDGTINFNLNGTRYTYEYEFKGAKLYLDDYSYSKVN